MHVSGERLSQLTGIAAILRYPMPDLDVLDEEKEDEANGMNSEPTGDHDDGQVNRDGEASAW